MKKALALISSFAFITITPSGKIVERVLGDSTLQVKSSTVAYADGKIQVQKGDLVEVEARANTNDLKIGGSDNKFTIEENGIIATTQFPITIDANKNTLSVTTNSGTRTIAILPYEAATVLMHSKLINKITGNQINLSENSNGELQYSISGSRNINLFNVATITANINSTVSATNGDVIKVDEPQWLKFFGFLFS